MEDNVILTREEFMEFIKLKTRVEVLVDFIKNDKYADKETIYAILGIGVKKDA